MEIVNRTPFQVEALPFKGPGNQPVLTMIVKGTFEIRPGEPAALASEQIPVAFGDEVYSENGGVKFEADIAPFKPRADIVLVGHAHAPGGKAVTALDVTLRVGELSKTIRVIGDRHWETQKRKLSLWDNFLCRFFPVFVSDPKPFTVMELTYERAFGGIDKEGGDWCKENLVGVGFFAKRSTGALNGAPLPNRENCPFGTTFSLEDPERLIKSWSDHPKPVGFGFYGRAWMPRASYIGVYNEKWRKERSPDPPEDFQFDYYNAAHPDLQVEGYLRGDEPVELIHLTPEGRARFRLRGVKVSAAVTKTDKYETGVERLTANEEIRFNLDTLCLIPDERRFYLVWRGLCPIKDLTTLEVSQATVMMVDESSRWQ
jgi:hypothetical protein